MSWPPPTAPFRKIRANLYCAVVSAEKRS
jgi:hypothetical protein